MTKDNCGAEKKELKYIKYYSIIWRMVGIEVSKIFNYRRIMILFLLGSKTRG